MRRFYTYSLLLLILLPCKLWGQDTAVSRQIISWQGQVPESNPPAKNKFSKKLSKLILGETPSLIIKPVYALADSSGALWILSQGNGQLVKHIPGVKDESVMSERDKYPSLVAMCILPGKGILFTDSFLNGVYLYSWKEQRIKKFIQDTSLDQPTGIAWSTANNELWVVETGAHRISVFDAEGHFLRSFGERGTQAGNFNFPTYLAIDSDGTACVVDAMNFRVQFFSPEGDYLSGFGHQGNASGSLARPRGIALDREGNIYIADALFNSVQLFDRKGQLLYYFGQQGDKDGEFWLPSGITIDHKGQIYVADSYNNRIQLFMLEKIPADE